MKKIILSVLLVFILIYIIIQPFYLKLSPTTGDEPIYEPKKWNSDSNIKNSHNCYTYMLNDINPFGQEMCKKYGNNKTLINFEKIGDRSMRRFDPNTDKEIDKGTSSNFTIHNKPKNDF